MMAKMLAVVVAGAVGVAGEGIGFGEWVSRGKISESSRRSLQSITLPACMSDCVFDHGSEPDSCADIQALFEGTHDSQLGPTGCGLDCTSADDVAAVQSLFRSLKVGHECVNVADGHVVDVGEAACGDTCTGDYEDESGNTASCETAFANAPNTMISSCPHGCTYKRNVWKQAAKSFGRNGDADPGCMLPFAFLTSVAEKSSCPIGYDLDNGNCVWDGEFCAEHTITNNGDGTYTHDYSLPTGKVCKSCWNGYTSDGQYVCPCSLSCTL